VVGLFAGAQYRNQTINPGHGDALVLFTDGVPKRKTPTKSSSASIRSETCSNLPRPHRRVAPRHRRTRVHDYLGDVPAGDDVDDAGGQSLSRLIAYSLFESTVRRPRISDQRISD